MAKLIGPLHSEQATGRLGGLVYQQRGSQSVVTIKASKISKHSPAKLKKFKQFSKYTSWWGKMSYAERLAWRQKHRTRPWMWWQHPELVRTGYSFFLSVASSLGRVLKEPNNYPWEGAIDLRLVELRASVEPEILNVWAEVDGSFPLESTYLFLDISRFHSPGRKPDFYSRKQYSQDLWDTTVGIDTENQHGVIDIWGHLFCDLGYRSNQLQRSFQI